MKAIRKQHYIKIKLTLKISLFLSLFIQCFTFFRTKCPPPYRNQVQRDVTLTPLLLGSKSFFCSRPDVVLNTRRELGLDIGESVESRLLFTICFLTAFLSEPLTVILRLQFPQAPLDFVPLKSGRRIQIFCVCSQLHVDEATLSVSTERGEWTFGFPF